MIKKLYTPFFLTGAVSMLIMSFHYFQPDMSGILRGKEVATKLWYRVAFFCHIALGMIAMFTGPLQLLPYIRNHTDWHRTLGQMYLLGVGLSGTAGLIIAQFAMGGWISTVGFSVLSLVWLYITWLGFKAIRYGQYEQHAKLMTMSFALTFAAITQRTMLLIPLLTSVPFMPVYQLSAWLPWMLNLAIAYKMVSRSRIIA